MNSSVFYEGLASPQVCGYPPGAQKSQNSFLKMTTLTCLYPTRASGGQHPNTTVRKCTIKIFPEIAAKCSLHPS